MNKIVIYNIVRFFVLLIVQVAIFKNIGYYNLAVAFPYIFVILLLPIGIPNFFVFLLSFLIGLCIDVFYDSLGVHATACVALAYFRIFFHKITIELDEQSSFNTPSWGNMGFKWYSTYILLSILVHHSVLFFVEAFSFHNFTQILASIGLSSIFTLVLIFVISLLTYHKKSRLVN